MIFFRFLPVFPGTSGRAPWIPGVQTLKMGERWGKMGKKWAKNGIKGRSEDSPDACFGGPRCTRRWKNAGAALESPPAAASAGFRRLSRTRRRACSSSSRSVPRRRGRGRGSAWRAPMASQLTGTSCGLRAARTPWWEARAQGPCSEPRFKFGKNNIAYIFYSHVALSKRNRLSYFQSGFPFLWRSARSVL